MTDFASKIAMARNGATQAVGDLLEPYRNYMRMLAASQMGRPVGKRVSPSDIVQDTMLAAHRDLGDFRGTTQAEFASWLRTVLSRCLLHAIEHNVKAEKRDVRREVSMDAMRSTLESSCAGLGDFLAQDQASLRQTGLIDWAMSLHRAINEKAAAQGLVLRQRVVTASETPEAIKRLALACSNSASVLWRNGRTGDAIECYKQSIEHFDHVSTLVSSPLAPRRELSITLNNLGMALSSLDRYAEADAMFRRAIAIVGASAIRRKRILIASRTKRVACSTRSLD